MPQKEYRSLDGIHTEPDGTSRIIEVDESQHFTRFRAATLRLYPPETRVAFPLGVWLSESLTVQKLPGGRFGRRCPPLFPMDGGRHRQRAFRDALADLLPGCYGFAPTLRLAYFELVPWIWSDDAESRLRELVESRLTRR